MSEGLISAVNIDTSGTHNSVNDALLVKTNTTSGTPAAGFGVALAMRADNSNLNSNFNQAAATTLRIKNIMTNVTDESETSKMTLDIIHDGNDPQSIFTLDPGANNVKNDNQVIFFKFKLWNCK